MFERSRSDKDLFLAQGLMPPDVLLHGEVFVDTGEASATDTRKLRWSASAGQRALVISALSAETDFLNGLAENDGLREYAESMTLLVEDAYRDMGLNPRTLRPVDTPQC
jgi:hypothetical protein